MIAKSIATQSMLFGASSAQRSPFLRFLDARNDRACAIIATRSLPVTAIGPESRSSASKICSAAVSRLAKSWLRKLTLAVHSHQPSQPFIHGRQIIFPAPLAFAGWEVWITPPQFFFEIDAHARH